MDVPAIRRELHGIRDDVGKDLHHPGVVGVQGHGMRWQIAGDADVPLAGRGLAQLAHMVEHLL